MTAYQMCQHCVMDTTDPDIVFDAAGVCHHCKRYEFVAQKRLIPIDKREAALSSLVDEIKSSGRGKSYDCIIGVSGGVDSTYVAYLVRNLGLRPLAVHLDNGWNSELAVSNIEKTLKTLGIDLYTHVIDWAEFRKLQVAYLRAATPDGEVPTDHAIFALLYQLASEHGLKHVILGTNVVSEAILPEKWGYGYFDWRYIKDVYRKFAKGTLKTYPHFSLPKLFYYVFVKRIRMVAILNYIQYDKKEAMDVLQNKLDWIYYGGKHYESIYTRFYQAYLLPRKFNIDKRRAHYSNLICSGQMTRQEALTALDEPVYPKHLLDEDREYVVKKLMLSEADFDGILKSPNKTFLAYRTSHGVFEFAKKIVNASRRWIG